MIGSRLLAQRKSKLKLNLISRQQGNLEIGEGITTHGAATAMAARIYFYHGKYDLAYERANEVIESGGYSLESNIADIYLKVDLEVVVLSFKM